MGYQPSIQADIDIAIAVEYPTFDLEVDGDEDGDYTGIFAGEGHDVVFYGPTPDHVIGAAHRYAGKLTGGEPHLLNIEVSEEILEDLVPLP